MKNVPRRETLSLKIRFFGDKVNQRVNAREFFEWGRIGFIANKRSKASKMERKGTTMMLMGYELDHPSGTYKFYDPINNDIFISNSL